MNKESIGCNGLARVPSRATWPPLWIGTEVGPEPSPEAPLEPPREPEPSATPPAQAEPMPWDIAQWFHGLTAAQQRAYETWVEVYQSRNPTISLSDSRRAGYERFWRQWRE